MKTENQKNLSLSCEVNETGRYAGEITNGVVRAYMERGNCLRSKAIAEFFIGLWNRFASVCLKLRAILKSAKQPSLKSPDRCTTHCNA